MTSDLATVLVVDRARTAAYAGDLDEAERILATLAPDATDEALDLRARVYAQRGDFAEADAWWARIPESPGAVAGRPLIAAIKAAAAVPAARSGNRAGSPASPRSRSRRWPPASSCGCTPSPHRQPIQPWRRPRSPSSERAPWSSKRRPLRRDKPSPPAAGPRPSTSSPPP
ncbi:tetratricopeptide repeat protein [Fodinicola feengrottensis]|uniref:hypothetical protein n=1 Tax=Fodinicola feengrottensis TaxID=435914 RepID=UPI00244360B4|nr:hypothetical protein [Fodinicola feengrottensis]